MYGQDVVYEVKGKNVIDSEGQARQKTSKDGKKRKITGVVNDVNGEAYYRCYHQGERDN